MKYALIILLFVLNCGNIETAAEKFADKINDHIDSATGTDSTDSADSNTGDSTDSTVAEDSQINISGDTVPQDRLFLGTFEKRQLSNTCKQFPGITRLYSHEDQIYIDNNKDELIAHARIFQDNTFDFAVQTTDVFGNPDNDLICTCYYVKYEWYGNEYHCQCDTCNLDYGQYN